MGELAALANAVTWALTNVILRGELNRHRLVALNATRSAIGGVCLWALVALAGQFGEIWTITWASLLPLLGSLAIGLALGDSLYLRSAMLSGISRTASVASIFPLFTAGIAVATLDEPVTALLLLGIFLVVAGVSLVSSDRGKVGSNPGRPWLGLALALAAAVCWGTSAVLMREAVRNFPPLLANSIRLPVGAALLMAISLLFEQKPRWGRLQPRSAATLWLAGLITAVSSSFFMVAVDLAGATRTAAISATSPVIAAPMAALLLRERVPLRVGLGIVCTAAGIILVVLSRME